MMYLFCYNFLLMKCNNSKATTALINVFPNTAIVVVSFFQIIDLLRSLSALVALRSRASASSGPDFLAASRLCL